MTKPLDSRRDLWNHSPTGFEWGYCGSGPAQLALALLADHLGEPPPENFTRTFAYLTGPSYGLLLDATGRPWRDKLTTDSDLSVLLRDAAGISVSAASSCAAIPTKSCVSVS